MTTLRDINEKVDELKQKLCIYEFLEGSLRTVTRNSGGSVIEFQGELLDPASISVVLGEIQKLKEAATARLNKLLDSDLAELLPNGSTNDSKKAKKGTAKPRRAVQSRKG